MAAGYSPAARIQPEARGAAGRRSALPGHLRLRLEELRLEVGARHFAPARRRGGSGGGGRRRRGGRRRGWRGAAGAVCAAAPATAAAAAAARPGGGPAAARRRHRRLGARCGGDQQARARRLGERRPRGWRHRLARRLDEGVPRHVDVVVAVDPWSRSRSRLRWAFETSRLPPPAPSPFPAQRLAPAAWRPGARGAAARRAVRSPARRAAEVGGAEVAGSVAASAAAVGASARRLEDGAVDLEIRDALVLEHEQLDQRRLAERVEEGDRRLRVLDVRPVALDAARREET